MNKGINLYLTSKIEEQRLLELFSKAGFDSVIVPFDFVLRHKENALSLLRDYNLKLQMVHCRYIEKNLNYFWLDDKRGEEVFLDYLFQIENIQHLSPVDFVIHLAGSKDCIYSKLGEDRLKKLVKKAKECGVRLCVENTFSTSQQVKIFENINDDNLKMCYDLGHENWLTPKDDLIEKLGDKIVQVHLHNNDGTFDWHQPIFEGSAPIVEKMKKLLKFTNNIDLSLELKFIDERLSLNFLKSMNKDLEELKKIMNKK